MLLREGVRHLVHILFCLHTVLLLCGALVNGEREIERERERELVPTAMSLQATH